MMTPPLVVRLNLPGFDSPEPFQLASAPLSITELACAVLEEIGGFSKDEIEELKKNIDILPLTILAEWPDGRGFANLVPLTDNNGLSHFLSAVGLPGPAVVEVRPADGGQVPEEHSPSSAEIAGPPARSPAKSHQASPCMQQSRAGLGTLSSSPGSRACLGDEVRAVAPLAVPAASPLAFAAQVPASHAYATVAAAEPAETCVLPPMLSSTPLPFDAEDRFHQSNPSQRSPQHSLSYPEDPALEGRFQEMSPARMAQGHGRVSKLQEPRSHGCCAVPGAVSTAPPPAPVQQRQAIRGGSERERTQPRTGSTGAGSRRPASATTNAGRRMPWEGCRQGEQSASTRGGRTSPFKREENRRPSLERRRTEQQIRDDERSQGRSSRASSRNQSPAERQLRSPAPPSSGDRVTSDGRSSSRGPSARARSPPRTGPPVPEKQRQMGGRRNESFVEESRPMPGSRDAAHVSHLPQPALSPSACGVEVSSVGTFEAEDSLYGVSTAIDPASQFEDIAVLRETIRQQQSRIEFLEDRHKQALTDLRSARQELASAHQDRFREADKASQLEQLISEIQAQRFNGAENMRWDEWLLRSRAILEGDGR
eukprot:TRINITY_DN29140_c0_g1_i1.p1 TRINITY_DN29140_c0_g1~~TRINITY_DN29140_c0_g1_i1.p1  ORF type:complete len:596 (+),score=92.62 TRINITY_DN29140_c0_g1_i1:64-1851(+)